MPAEPASAPSPGAPGTRCLSARPRRAPHPLLFGVELEALRQGAGLGLVVALALQTDALRIRDVLVFGVCEQAVGGGGEHLLENILQNWRQMQTQLPGAAGVSTRTMHV